MSDELRDLIDRLARCSNEGGSLRLTPRCVDVALAALRACDDQTLSSSALRSETFQVELMNEGGQPGEVLAVTRDLSLAQAALDEAQRRHPGRKLEVRLEAREASVPLAE